MAVFRPEPLAFADLLPRARRVEHFGLGSFGWGVAWLEGGLVRRHRSTGRLVDDPAAGTELSEVRSTHFLLHFRRPNRLSTVQLADTQPFLAEPGRFAFCHNGTFTREPEFRARYGPRLQGLADSEVGFRMLEDLLAEGRRPEDAMAALHASLDGSANLGFLSAIGDLLVFNAYARNRMWRFRAGGAEMAATGLHSDDDSLFTLVFPDAEHQRQVTGAHAVGAPRS